MAQAKMGDTVKVHYTGKFEDGTVFDTSDNREPLQFTIGQGQVIPGFERAVVGMNPEESKTTIIPSNEAYGPHYKEMVIVVDKSSFPPNLEPEINQRLQLCNPNGQVVLVTVIEIAESTVTLDANHPLAGKDLTFDLKLVEILK